MAKRKVTKPEPLGTVDHPDAHAFVSTIAANPDDITPRLVFADFLDENGHPHHAAALRMDAAGKKSVESRKALDLLGVPPHPTPIKSVEIRGRRWFQKSYGNTYHTADIFVNGEHVHTLPVEYGYGDQYHYRAKEWLHDAGYLPESLRRTPGWHLRDDQGIDWLYHATDVKRERDL